MTTQYKQPRSFNGVSLTLLLLAALTGWVGVSAWPAIALSSNVKSELEDYLPKVYTANLRPEPTSTATIAQLHDDLIARLKVVGVDDPHLVVDLARDQKRVAIEARYSVTVLLRGTRKKRVFALHPRVETDAARVEW